MADTAIVDAALGAETADPTTTSAPAPSLSEAGAALKGKTSWEEVFTPAAAETAEAPETPAAEAAPTEQAPEPMAGFTLDETGRLHRADGTYASQAEVDQWNSAASAPTEPAADATPAEPTPEPIVVKLRGRDGSEREIEVTDPDVAEVLRTNHREGMRAAEYNRRMAEVQAKEEEFRAFETMVEQNPEGVILRHLPVEKQDALLVALLARRWEHVAPHLVKFDTDPAARAAEIINSQERMSKQDGDFSTARAKAEYGKNVYTETVKLIPEHVDEATHQRFLVDAGRDLEQAIKQNNGNAIPVEQIKTILAPRLALYGFDKPSPAAASQPSTPKRPVARPVPAAMQPSAPAPANPGAAIKWTVTAQRIAAATPPQGAGAAPVRQPLVPTNATVTDASRALKKAKSWAEVT